MNKPIVAQHIVNGKKYFHLTCECRNTEGGVFYSVVHEWDKLAEWLNHLQDSHDCKANMEEQRINEAIAYVSMSPGFFSFKV